VTRIDQELIEIIDVEKVLSEITGQKTEVSDDILSQSNREQHYHVVVVDDSSVARNQVKRTLEQLGITVTLANDGQEGLALLKSLAMEHGDVTKAVSMVISDVEMPKMDGYTLTAELRKDPMLKELFVVLHTSLSGVFNKQMVQKVGADEFLPKFHPDELASLVLNILKSEKVKAIESA
jgi:two-component system chemotaxis response regulator CheV